MLVASRSKSLLRQCSIPSVRFGLVSREYHGDPGPSTRSNQKELRSALVAASRSETGHGSGKHLPKNLVNANRDVLDNLLNAKPVDVPMRERSNRNVSLPLRLPGTNNNQTSGSKFNNKYRHNDQYQHQQQQPEDPYTTSIKLKRLIDKYSRSHNQATESQIEEIISVVTNAPRNLVNAPVWNILFGFLGRQRRLNWLWSLYNDMKKRGVKPTTRTYSTIINAYSRISHSGDTSFEHDLMPVKSLTHSRVTILFEQSQQHIKKCMTASTLLKEEDPDLGITTSSGGRLIDANGSNHSGTDQQNEYQDEVNISPTNAYLKYLGRHGLWEEMHQTFISMDPKGPLSPDIVTYTTLFSSLHNIHLIRTRQRKLNGGSSSTDANGDTAKSIDIGPISRGIWDQCIRQFGRLTTDNSRKLDNDLINHVLRCLIKGRPEDRRFAINLVDEIWSLPPPGKQSNLASTVSSPDGDTPLGPSLSSTRDNLPKLSPNFQSATSLIQGLLSSKQNVLASHYTNLLLSRPEIQSSVDLHFLKIALLALSETGDIGSIMNILDSYQPPTGKEGWDLSIYRTALLGSRWAGDFPTALRLFKRATQITDHVEAYSPSNKSMDQEEEYQWITPNGDVRDSRGLKWIKPKPIQPDSSILSILLKIAISSNNESIQKVLNIINHFGSERLLSIYPNSIKVESKPKVLGRNRDTDGSVLLINHTPTDLEIIESKKGRVLGDLIDFAKLIISSIERLNPGQQLEYQDMSMKMGKIVDTWAGEIVKSKKGVITGRKSNANMVSNDYSAGNSHNKAQRREDQWEDKESDQPSDYRNNKARGTSDVHGRTGGTFERRHRNEDYDRPRRQFNGDRERRNDDYLRGKDRRTETAYGNAGSSRDRLSGNEDRPNRESSYEHRATEGSPRVESFKRYEIDSPTSARRFGNDGASRRSEGSGFGHDRPRRDEHDAFEGNRPGRAMTFGRDNSKPRGSGQPKKLGFGLKKQ